MICYVMVTNEIRKFQTKLKLKLFRQIKSFLKNKCFKLLFKNGEAATCSYS